LYRSVTDGLTRQLKKTPPVVLKSENKHQIKSATQIQNPSKYNRILRYFPTRKLNPTPTPKYPNAVGVQSR